MTGGSCLNCGAPLAGEFCSGCGQRVVPAEPTIGELAAIPAVFVMPIWASLV